MAATETGIFIHTCRSVRLKQTALVSISTNKQQVVEQAWSSRFSGMCPGVWWKVLHCMLFLLPLHSHHTHNPPCWEKDPQSKDFMNYVTNNELSIQLKLLFILWMSDEERHWAKNSKCFQKLKWKWILVFRYKYGQLKMQRNRHLTLALINTWWNFQME